jgi:transposase-like protein
MTAFLHRLTEKHDVSDTEFFTDAGGYLATLARLDLRGELNYSERNLVGKWFHTVTMRIGRFHSFWRRESSQHSALAATVQASLQPRPTEKRSMDERQSGRLSTRRGPRIVRFMTRIRPSQ